jgi:hypothetical protein
MPCTLVFDGKKLTLVAQGLPPQEMPCSPTIIESTSDLTDDTVYSLTGDDIDTVCDDESVTLLEGEFYQVKKGIEAGLGNDWYDVVKYAIEAAVDSRHSS